MFLFDRERTGRIPFDINPENHTPLVVWDKKLPQSPSQGPESSAVIDQNGNIYFGCHDGCIYSLDSNGHVRWQFVTRSKVYSSPILLDEKLFFCINRAEVICLDTDGNHIWSFIGKTGKDASGKVTSLFGGIISLLHNDYYSNIFDKIVNYKKVNTWCSPNNLKDGSILVSLYQVGLVCLDLTSGRIKWNQQLGFPFHHLSSPAVASTEDGEFIAVLSQSNAIYWIDDTGNIVWQKKLKLMANSWGTPVIDSQFGHIYCTTSYKNSWCYLYKFDFEGNLLWKRKLSGGVRGGIGLSHGDFMVVPTLSGQLNLIRKDSGDIVRKIQLADRDKGFWTSAAIDKSDNIYINAKFNQKKGALIKLSRTGDIIWQHDYGKALSVPIVDSESNVYVGTWDGRYLKLKI